MSTYEIKANAVEVLTLLAVGGRTLPDPAALDEWALFADPSRLYREVWSEREMTLLTMSADDLPQASTRAECVNLLTAAIDRCREVAADLALTSDDNTTLPCGSAAPAAIVQIAQRTAGGNLPAEAETLAVEVVRQAFLSSRKAVTRGVPALRVFRTNRVMVPKQENGQSETCAGPTGGTSQERSYMISYEGPDPSSIHRSVKAVASYWGRTTETSWLVRYPGSAQELVASLPDEGRLVVVRVADDVATRHLGERLDRWVADRIEGTLR